MGLFDILNDSPEDSGDDGFAGFLNEMMLRARESQFIQQWYTIANGAYSELSVFEPEHRTHDQQVIMTFIENLSHTTVASLGWCTMGDDPMHVEEHKAAMRGAAIELKQEWDAMCADDSEGSFQEVNQVIKNMIESI